MSNGQIVGYVRVSTEDQNTARQVEALQAFNPDKTFTDMASGKNTDRPGLQDCMAYIRQGDTLAVASLDRLGRSLIDIRTLVTDLTNRGIKVRFIKENLEFNPGTDNPFGILMMNMLASFAEFERSLILSRQAEGIAIAKAEGKYRGRQSKITAAQVAEMKAQINAGTPKARVARDFGIGRETLYRHVRSSPEAVQGAQA